MKRSDLRVGGEYALGGKFGRLLGGHYVAHCVVEDLEPVWRNSAQQLGAVLSSGYGPSGRIKVRVATPSGEVGYAALPREILHSWVDELAKRAEQEAKSAETTKRLEVEKAARQAAYEQRLAENAEKERLRIAARDANRELYATKVAPVLEALRIQVDWDAWSGTANRIVINLDEMVRLLDQLGCGANG